MPRVEGRWRSFRAFHRALMEGLPSTERAGETYSLAGAPPCGSSAAGFVVIDRATLSSPA